MYFKAGGVKKGEVQGLLRGLRLKGDYVQFKLKIAERGVGGRRSLHAMWDGLKVYRGGTGRMLSKNARIYRKG